MDLAQSPVILEKLRCLVEHCGSCLTKWEKKAKPSSVGLALVQFKVLAFIPTYGLGGEHGCNTDLKCFFLKRISNRIGGSPHQLLMKRVRLAGSAVFRESMQSI